MQTKQVVLYNVPMRSESEVVRYLLKKGCLRHIENKAHAFIFFSQIIPNNKRV